MGGEVAVDQFIGGAGRLAEPVKVDLGLLVLAEVPLHVGAVEAFDDVGDEDGHGVGDVETLGEAVHRDLDGTVANGLGFVGKAGEFGAEEEGSFLIDGEIFDEDAVFGGQGGHEGVAGGVQTVGTLPHIAFATLVVADGQPLVGTHRDGAVRRELVFVLNDVDVLHAIALAGAHHRADVLGLVQVFQHHGEVARSIF